MVVFLAGLDTALATGLGALPFFFEDLPERRMVWWAVFSGLPQPVGAAVAFAFVRLARRFLPFGFAAGATTYLVLTEFIPEALETGAGLPLGGKLQLAGGSPPAYWSCFPCSRCEGTPTRPLQRPATAGRTQQKGVETEG